MLSAGIDPSQLTAGALMHELKIRERAFNFLPGRAVTEVDVYFILDAMRQLTGYSQAKLYAGMTGEPPPLSSVTDAMQWFFQNWLGRIYVGASDLSAGLFLDDPGEILIVFGTRSFVDRATPYPGWLARTRFVNAADDPEQTGWPNKFWTQHLGE